MAGEQDIVSLGLNIDSFNAQKMQRLRDFITLFNDLSKFDGKIFSPVMGDGLSSFNTSVAQTSKLLDEMNNKLNGLNSRNKDVSNSASSAAKSTTELGLAVGQHKKNVDEAATAQAKLSAATATQAKETAALKVQLAEIKKAITDEAKANNELYQARLRDIEQKKQQKKIDAENAATQKKAAKEVSDSQKQQTREAIANMKLAEKTVKDQQKEVDRLADKWLQLKNVLKGQQKEYVNNFVANGADDESTKRSLRVAQETAGIMDGINVDLRTAEGNATRFGRSLTRSLSVLRQAAYILPGIGIAGIFNLAFEAIGKVIERTGIFTSKLAQLNDATIKNNKSLKEQISLYEQIISKMKELSSLDDKSIANQQKGVDKMKERGLSQDQILAAELDVTKSKVALATKNVQNTFGDPSKIQGELSKTIENIKALNIRIADVRRQEKKSEEIQRGVPEKDQIEGVEYLQLESRKQLKRRADLATGQLELQNKKYEILKSTSDEYYSSIQEQEEKTQEISRFNSDQQRKELVEKGKDNISVNQAVTKDILSNIQKTHEERIKAFKDELNEQKQLNSLDAISVTGTASNPNLTATPSEKRIAINKQNTENLKAVSKYNSDVLRENIEYYQRNLLAQIEVQKSLVEVDSINNEKIEQNETASLEDRLKAYANYIDDKTKLEQLEYELDISAGKSSATDKKSSLTKDERDRITSDRDKQILINKANAEASIYSIVYSSLQRQLKAVVDAGISEGEYNDQKLIDDLKKNNAAYKNKEENLVKYLKKRKDILEKDERETLQKDIDDDKRQGLRLFNLQQQLLIEEEIANTKLESAKALPESSEKKFAVDTAQGEVNARGQSLSDVNKQISINKKKQKADELKQAKIAFDDDNKLRNEWIDAALRIEHKLYESIKNINERIIDNRIQLVERQKDLFDEQAEAEIYAIAKSSLNEKDKLALDIQLNAQKHEADVEAQKQERRLKIEEAEFNKKLAISNAAIGISAAVIRDGLTTPKSIADAIIGAIELAEIISTPIPSFKEGTDFFKGGWARYGEAGPEIVKKPGQKPYLALKETISDLPKGTKIIPLRTDSPEFNYKEKDESWDQTRFLAAQIKKSNKEIKNVFKPTIIVDMKFENRKREIFGN